MSEQASARPAAGGWIRDGQLDAEQLIPALETFLRDLLKATPFDLRAQIRRRPTEQAEVENIEIVVELDGPDADLLLERRGELLWALEDITLRWLRLAPGYHDHIRFDCRDYRAGRVAELKLAAQTAAERVRNGRTPFRFQPMNARERRIVHLALKDEPGVRTASEGERSARAVVVYPD